MTAKTFYTQDDDFNNICQDHWNWWDRLYYIVLWDVSYGLLDVKNDVAIQISAHQISKIIKL